MPGEVFAKPARCERTCASRASLLFFNPTTTYITWPAKLVIDCTAISRRSSPPHRRALRLISVSELFLVDIRFVRFIAHCRAALADQQLFQ